MLLEDLPGDAAPDEHGHRTAFEHLARLQAIDTSIASRTCSPPDARAAR